MKHIPITIKVKNITGIPFLHTNTIHSYQSHGSLKNLRRTTYRIFVVNKYDAVAMLSLSKRFNKFSNSAVEVQLIAVQILIICKGTSGTSNNLLKTLPFCSNVLNLKRDSSGSK